MIKKLTPVLIVDAIEPVLPFWLALGFTQGPTVPFGDAIGFTILERDGIEVMYQTVDSTRADVGKVLEGPRPIAASSLYFEVDDLDSLKFPAGTDVIIERRQTFYGATETWVRDPAGNVLGFAQHGSS